MAKTVSLQVSPRTGVGRTALKAVRQAGRVPGILYGKSKDKTVRSRPIEIDARKLNSVLHSSTSENVLVDVELTDASGAKLDQGLALLQDVQHHPLEDYIIHIDLHEIAQDEILHAEVPVTSVGEPDGVKNGGGLLETMLRTIRVACLPRDLPELFTVDVSHLKIGQSVHVSELKLPEGVTISNPPELPVFSVFAPKEEVVETPAAAAADAQPEVIKEKKAEGESAVPEAKTGGKDAKPAAKAEPKK
jgi:large subunit ribosomal protein L25